MTFGAKLSKLRREHNYTQEQLAQLLGVSRQAISKWESDGAYPETDKLIRMSALFSCSLDYLLKDEVESEPEARGARTADVSFLLRRSLRERKSEKTVWGMPLWHVGKNAKGVLAVGIHARGIIAIGMRATGVVSFGLLSLGFLSFGMASLGLLSAGLFALGALTAGCFSVGVLAAGAISVGIVSLGAVAVGDFSVGALAIGKYVAIGDHARAAIAWGGTKATGSLFQKIGALTEQDASAIKSLLDAHAPAYFGWAKALIKSLL